MFFHHLKNFSPYSGHIYDDMKVPIIRKKDAYIEKSDERFDLIERIGYFPFKELRHGGQAYFISDTELFDFLKTTEDSLDNYEVSFYLNWNFQEKEIFADLFAQGYDLAILEFNNNIIQSHTLPYEHKATYIRNFCLFCLDFLYFDGELNKGLFYNLGYLQASLYRGFIELNNFTSARPGGSPGFRLHYGGYFDLLNNAESKAEAALEIVESKIEIPRLDIEIPEQTVFRIELMCDLEEVRAIWQVLTAPIKTNKGIQEATFSPEQLTNFLGSAFSSGAFPKALLIGHKSFKNRTPKGDMRTVLNALMYATYHLNHEHNRSAKLIEYAHLLVQHFPVFSGSQPDSVKSVMSTHTPNGMEVLTNSQSINPYVDKMLSILKKHKILH